MIVDSKHTKKYFLGMSKYLLRHDLLVHILKDTKKGQNRKTNKINIRKNRINVKEQCKRIE